MKEAVAARPTEALTGLALAGSIFGFLTQAGVSDPVSAIVAVVVAFLPAAVSSVIDEIKASS